MNKQNALGGQFTFPGTSLQVQRVGYGAMQLAGPGVWVHSHAGRACLVASPIAQYLIDPGHVFADSSS
jgi:hypothetical protein